MQKKKVGKSRNIECEVEGCISMAQALSYGGQPGCECKHLQNVKFADLFTDERPFSEKNLEEMKGLNWISERKKKKCLDFKEKAAESSASLIYCLLSG